MHASITWIGLSGETAVTVALHRSIETPHWRLLHCPESVKKCQYNNPDIKTFTTSILDEGINNPVDRAVIHSLHIYSEIKAELLLVRNIVSGS